MRSFLPPSHHCIIPCTLCLFQSDAEEVAACDENKLMCWMDPSRVSSVESLSSLYLVTSLYELNQRNALQSYCTQVIQNEKILTERPHSRFMMPMTYLASSWAKVLSAVYLSKMVRKKYLQAMRIT